MSSEGWDETPAGLLRLRPDGTVLAANRVVRTWTGRDELVDARLPDLLTVGGRIYWETHLGPLLHVEGRLDEVAVELRGSDGRVPVLLTAVAEGDVVHVLLAPARERARYERELLAAQTEAADTAERLRALQAVTAALSGAHGTDGIAAAVLDAATGPLGGSAGTVWVRDGSGLVPRASRGEAPPELPASGLALQERSAGRYGDAVVVALHGRTELQGAVVVRPRADAGADPPDLDFLTAVGQQGGLALERAVLHEQSARVAHQLQQSLLDVDPPDDPRFSVATAYRAGVEMLEVGGDFFDVFLTEDGVLAVVIGDVVGRGLAAASAMGQLRSAVRAVAGPGIGPAELLSRLDRFVEHVPAAALATLAYAELDLANGQLRYACAGHPPPVLLPAGAPARALWEGRSTPLGAYAAKVDGVEHRPEAVVRLAPGDRLLLYTDGLVERRHRGLDDALDRLVATSDGIARDGDLGEAVRSLTGTLLADEQGRDDVCVLLLAWAEPAFECDVPVDLAVLSDVRRDLSTWLVDHGVDADTADDVVLATSEAVANAAEHGTQDRTARVSLRAHLESAVSGRDVVVRVRDTGRWRAPTASPERGRGLTIMGALVDDVVVQVGDGTTVLLRRRVVS